MQLNRRDTKNTYELCKRVTDKFDGLEDLTLQRYAAFELLDLLLPIYNVIAFDINTMLFKYVESDNGKPKYKAQIISLKSKEEAAKEYLYKNEGDKEKHEKELHEYYEQLLDIPIKHHDAKYLLETKIKCNNVDMYLIINLLNRA